jgi:uncharacterized membrane protein
MPEPRMLAEQSPVGPILVWSLVLFVTVIVGFVLVSWAKRRLTASEESPSGFSLAELRELHRSGRLSDQEYARARERLLASMQRASDAKRGGTAS